VNHKTEDIRKKETLKALMPCKKISTGLKPEKHLNLGCGDESFTLKVANLFNVQEVYGVNNIIDGMLVEAERKGVEIYVTELITSGPSFADCEFDVV
jgi:ubiquinone/menaquinone biosynthesis C-methylase UbiE